MNAVKHRVRNLALTLTIVFLGTLLSALTVPIAAVAATAPRSGGNLTILYDGLTWSTFDPDSPTGTTADFVGTSVPFQNLFTFSNTGALEPLLATSYSYNSAHTVLTINLRHHVTFQDGTPFNAAAVVFNLERVAPASTDSECVPFFQTVSSFVAVNTYTVKITTFSPYSAMLDILAGEPCSFIASPTAINSEGSNFGEEPVGTSPYKFQSAVLDQTITFVRYTHAWQKAYLNSITESNIGSDLSGMDAVQAGTADAFSGGYSSTQDIPIAKGMGGLVVTQSAQNTSNFIRLQVSKPPFNNIVARRAVANALNLSLLTKTLYGRYNQPTESVVPPQSWAFDGTRVKGYPQYNPSLAASEVASLPGGKLAFTLDINNVANQEQLGAAIAGELQAIPGVTVTLNALAKTTELSALHTGTFQGYLAAGPALPDPDLTFWRNFYSSSNDNYQGYSNAAFDALVSQARETFSQPQRKKLYNEAQAILAQTVPVLPLFNSPVFWVTNKRVHDMPLPGGSSYDFSQTWMS